VESVDHLGNGDGKFNKNEHEHRLGVNLNSTNGYYGRRAQRSQQDTVLQHHRMYGSRPPEDLAVTRFYTSREIYDVLKRIHEFDKSLRLAFEAGGQKSGVVFIQKDASNKIVPCAPNKLLLSSITTLNPRKRMVPYGFQTGYKSHIGKTIEVIDNLIKELIGSEYNGEHVFVDVNKAIDIVKLISQTYVKSDDTGFEWDIDTFIATIEYVSNVVAQGGDKGKIVILSRTDRSLSRIRKDGRYEDAPDGGSIGKKYDQIPTTTATLMLFRQSGEKDKGWRDCPFWWPVLYMPKEMKTVVFSREISEAE
jgi:hypothetical protein